MSKFRNKYRIESARLKYWDYSTPSWYYVTINTKNKVHWFGKVSDAKMILNKQGIIANDFWLDIPKHYKTVELDEFVIMPNHIHGILILNYGKVETPYMASLLPILGDIIGKYKGAVTRKIRKEGFKNFQWQSRFYDRIIRDERELRNIRKYINDNPLNWDLYGEMHEDFDKLFGKKRDV